MFTPIEWRRQLRKAATYRYVHLLLRLHPEQSLDEVRLLEQARRVDTQILREGEHGG